MILLMEYFIGSKPTILLSYTPFVPSKVIHYHFTPTYIQVTYHIRWNRRTSKIECLKFYYIKKKDYILLNIQCSSKGVNRKRKRDEGKEKGKGK